MGLNEQYDLEVICNMFSLKYFPTAGNGQNFSHFAKIAHKVMKSKYFSIIKIES